MRNVDPTFGDLADLRSKMLLWARRFVQGADVDDLVQAAMLKMWANRHRAPTILEEIEPWASVVLTNTWRNDRKSDSRRPQHLSIDYYFNSKNTFRKTDNSNADRRQDVLLPPAVENPETQTICRQLLGRMDPDDVLDALAIPRDGKRDRVLSLSKEAVRVRRFHARQACARVAV